MSTGRRACASTEARQALSGLLEVQGVPSDLGGGVLVTLDKLDILSLEKVAAELVDARSLAPDIADVLVGDLTATDAVEQMSRRPTLAVDRV